MAFLLCFTHMKRMQNNLREFSCLFESLLTTIMNVWLKFSENDFILLLLSLLTMKNNNNFHVRSRLNSSVYEYKTGVNEYEFNKLIHLFPLKNMFQLNRN